MEDLKGRRKAKESHCGLYFIRFSTWQKSSKEPKHNWL